MADVEVQNSKSAGKKALSASKTSASSVVPEKTSASNVPGNSKGSSSSKDAGVSKEVLLILKELNQNLNAQNERLEKQEQRLESLSEQFAGYGYEYDDYDDSVHYDQESFSYDQSSLPTDDDTDTSSVFKGLAAMYQSVDHVDSDVNKDLANFVNNSFRNGLPDDKLSEMLKEIHRPANCETLVKTRVNQGIWRLLKAHVQADDNRIQSIQEIIVKATVNLVKLTNKLGEKLEPADMNTSTSAIALLGQANKMLNVRRKEVHKSSLDPKYHYLASASLPFTDYLYGDDTDVNRNVKEINDLNKIGRHMGYGRGMQRGSNRFRPYRPRGGPRGGVRGRGIRPRYDGPPAPKKPKQGLKN